MNRFIKEFANYKLNQIKNNELMQENFKIEKIAKIEKILNHARCQIITIDETMQELSKI